MADKQPKTALHGEIINLWVSGLSNAGIAAQLGCSTETIRNVKKNPDYKQTYFEKQREQITELIPLAVKRLRDILTSNKHNGSTHIAAVREVLERSHLTELTANPDKEIKVTINYE
ncbi:MAG: LuxR C-terminal-related transcriptional regulator [Eubacterium sp.]|jgi:uncharacterized protein YjcR|nr:LuxR C-terminal-related transcriptional regulator [Eubacterium sp.]